MGACFGKTKAKGPLDATQTTRPAEVPCPLCGESNYLNPGRKSMKCFSCGKGVITRTGEGAAGLPSSREIRDEKMDEAIRARKEESAKYISFNVGLSAAY